MVVVPDLEDGNIIEDSYGVVFRETHRGGESPTMLFSLQHEHVPSGINPMMLRFKAANDQEWLAIWTSQIRFGVSTDYDPEIMNTPSGIKFCNLQTGETRFLEYPDHKLPTQEQLDEMGEGALEQLLGRSSGQENES